jgi:hypothetical protein
MSQTKATFTLSPQSTVAEALTALQQGKLTSPQLVEWLLATPLPIVDVCAAIGTVDQTTFATIMAKQNEYIAAERAAAVAAASKVAAPGKITLKVAKRGGISMYGINVRQPVTLYRDQWARLAEFIGAADGNKLAEFIASAPQSVFSAASDFGNGNDPEYLAEIRAGKHAHASIVGDVVTVRLASKS